MTFDGATFSPEQDGKRLTSALERIAARRNHGYWLSLKAWAELGRCSEAGAGARLRDFNKAKFAHFGLKMESKRAPSLWLYRVLPRVHPVRRTESPQVGSELSDNNPGLEEPNAAQRGAESVSGPLRGLQPSHKGFERKIGPETPQNRSPLLRPSAPPESPSQPTLFSNDPERYGADA